VTRAVPKHAARRLLLLPLAAALATTGGPAAALEDIDRLREAVARHPDDPDLAWALARHLADTAPASEAVEALEALVVRWPGNAEARLRLGRLLAALGRHADAVVQLAEAVALAPQSGAARVHLGLSLDAVGRFDEADAQLVRAAELDPSLRAETLLLRGVSRIERGDEEEGIRLLEEAIELDPLGDVAEVARLLLAAATRPEPPRVRAQAYGGMDYDSNVTLDSGTTPALATDRSDGAAVWGAMLSGDVLTGDDHVLTLGARYHERSYLALDAYDERTFMGVLSGQLRMGDRLAARITALGAYVTLGDAPFLGQARLQPELLVWLGEGAGVLQVGPFVEGDFYDDEPLFSSLERDAVAFGGIARHLFSLPGWEAAQGAWGLRYERVVTAAERDVLGFEGDYDRHHFGGDVEVDLPLPWKTTAALELGVAGQIYDNDSLLDYLAQLDAYGVAERRPRRDVLLETGVGLIRPVHGHVDVEVRWRFQQRFSNTEVFGYERHVVGALVRLRTF